MVVRTCDRCGKEIPAFTNGYFYDIFNAPNPSRMMISRYAEAEGKPTMIGVDLCAECEHAVEEFIFGNKGDGSNEVE